MTRTEQIRLVKLASRYIALAEHANNTSFATLCIGVPLTMLAFKGFSPWPGIIFWIVSWGSYAVGKCWTAHARRLHAAVNQARAEQ